MKKLTVEEMGRIDVAAFKAADKLPLVMVLDNVRSLYNVGSVLRTADAFRLSGVWLCGITATPETNLVEIHKTALGAEDSVDWHYAHETMEAINRLRADGFTIVSIEQCHGSVMLNDWQAWPAEDSKKDKEKNSSCNEENAADGPKTPRKYAFVMGNEVKGVQQSVVDASDLVIEIPQYGTKHSMNVSVTAGIVMWEVMRQAMISLPLQNEEHQSNP